MRAAVVYILMAFPSTKQNSEFTGKLMNVLHSDRRVLNLDLPLRWSDRVVRRRNGGGHHESFET